MTTRRMWTAIPGLAALVAGALALSAYSGASSSQGRGPEQPIAFPHPVHVQRLGMNCLYCHYTANKSPDPGMPAVSTCMGCHLIIGPQRPASDIGPARTSAELQKLHRYADLAGGGRNARPIPWERIHKVPDYVNFPHMRHVNAGVTCQACHGEIQNMNRVYQYSSLNMGWCVRCHINGYDPQEGLRLAGAADRSAVRPVSQQGEVGSPQDTGGAQKGVSPAESAAAASQAPAAQTPAAPGAASRAPGSIAATPQRASQAGTRRYARYDCANCHF
ncbi:MAG: cytochrome c3 family protein [Gemmatimonadaceae bacterium]